MKMSSVWHRSSRFWTATISMAQEDGRSANRSSALSSGSLKPQTTVLTRCLFTVRLTSAAERQTIQEAVPLFSTISRTRSQLLGLSKATMICSIPIFNHSFASRSYSQGQHSVNLSNGIPATAGHQ